MNGHIYYLDRFYHSNNIQLCGENLALRKYKRRQVYHLCTDPVFEVTLLMLKCVLLAMEIILPECF